MATMQRLGELIVLRVFFRLVLWKDSTSRRLASLFLLVNRTLWTALRHLVTMVVMAVLWTMLLSTLKATMVSTLNKVTHIWPRYNHFQMKYTCTVYLDYLL